MSRTYRRSNLSDSMSLHRYVGERLNCKRCSLWGSLRDRPEDEYVEQLTKWYMKSMLDHDANYNGRGGDFRAHCSKAIRGANKRLCKKIVKGEEWDQQPYPDVLMTKKYIWDFY